MFLPEAVVAAVAPCSHTDSGRDVLEEAEDEGNLVICMRLLSEPFSLLWELLLVLRVFATAARRTSFSNSKLW